VSLCSLTDIAPHWRYVGIPTVPHDAVDEEGDVGKSEPNDYSDSRYITSAPMPRQRQKHGQKGKKGESW
jgi:hypothetical protein